MDGEVERVDTPRGELALRRRDGHYQIISNGTFLMDTRDGSSERLLVTAALDACAAPAPRVLIGGLGVGFSLAEAVAHASVAAVTVVEIEPAVVGWQRGHLRAYSGGALDDPRVTLVCADLIEWLDRTGCTASLVRRTAPDEFDAICLDIDNGPHWTVTERNRTLYHAAGLELLARRLRPGGALAIWSAARVPEFEARLRERFGEVREHPVPVPRGEPDVVYVAVNPV
jgi:spermidine synthase